MTVLSSNGISYTSKTTSLYWIRALNSKLASILIRTWNRSFERNALIWLTCVKCKQRWKLMDRRIFRDRKLDPPIPASWAVHVRLGFRQLSDNWCDKLQNWWEIQRKRCTSLFSIQTNPGLQFQVWRQPGARALYFLFVLVVCVQLSHFSLGDWKDISIVHAIIIIKWEVSTLPIVIIFSVVVCLRCLFLSYTVTYYTCIPRKLGFLFSLLLHILWWVQIVGYVLDCRSYSSVCTLHHLNTIIIQTYSETLNL